MSAFLVADKQPVLPTYGGNRNATRLKLLWFDRNGYCVLYKRLHRAVFEVPLARDGSGALRIDGSALAKLLRGVDRR